jgi:hypothetical protein
MSEPALLAEIPAILRHAAATGPSPPLRRVVRGLGLVCASNGVLALRMDAGRLHAEALLRARPHPGLCRAVDREFRRWRGDGRTHRLPAFDDDGYRERMPLPVGGTCLMARWVAFLLDHRIRVVRTGLRRQDPVRFDAGDAEGLLMPCWPARSSHWKGV